MARVEIWTCLTSVDSVAVAVDDQGTVIHVSDWLSLDDELAISADPGCVEFNYDIDPHLFKAEADQYYLRWAEGDAPIAEEYAE